MPLALRAWLDVASIRPDRATRANLVVEIEATGVPVEGERPPQTTVLAIDISGSMDGAPLDQVIRSVDLLLDALRPEDRVGVVAFSDAASSVVAPVRADDEGKRLVRSRVARLRAEGNTNVESAIDVAAASSDERCGVVLLSDGVPNRGALTAEALAEIARRHRPRVTFASLGYGADHAEDLLAAVADAGGGEYAFVQDPATCVRSFARAIGARGDVVASAIDLVLAPADDVAIADFASSEKTRFTRDGVVVALGDMVAGMRRVVVAEIAIGKPGDSRFLAPIANLSVKWRDREVDAVTSTALAIEIAAREPLVVAEALARVVLVRAERARVDARAAADRGQFAAAASILREAEAEVARVPGFVQGEATPLGEAHELLVDERAAMERRPAPEAYARYRKAAVAAKVTVPATSRGVVSAKLLEHAAGKYPVAHLVHEGAKTKLKDECIIGRTASADIAIANESIARRHAEVYAVDGEFWLCDLGSSRRTELNGTVLGAEPMRLHDGDILRVGDVLLRYEEESI